MNPILSEQTAKLLQVKRALDQIADGSYGVIPEPDDPELAALFISVNRASSAVEGREELLRQQNVQLASLVSRIETLLDASIDGVAYIDTDMSFQFVNRRFCEILGLRRGALNRKTNTEAHELWSESVVNPQRLVRVLTPPPHDDEDGILDVVDDVIELRDTEPRYAQVYGAPVFDDDGAYAGRIISLHDNTREMELDRMKTEFISVVSHELRTPLTSIKGYTDLLITGATGEINDVQREFLGILQSSANRLGNLINDILDLSRIDAGRMEVKHIPVDYAKIVGDLARLMKASADEKEISIDVSYPQDMPKVFGDPDKIMQVVSNLLSNAVKYTLEGGWIKIMLEVTGDVTVRTCIADSGIGISPADQKRLFQKFFRADNSLTRQAGGTGLGLVIVKSIIEMLGGAIWVHSEPGRGSKFYYTLPLCHERADIQQSPDSGRSTESSGLADRGLGLILVVDSSSPVRESLQHSLHRRGYGVLTAGSNQEALQKARQHKPNVIILDTMMEQCAGFSVLSSLLTDPATDALPVLAVSLDTDSTTEKITLGAFSFLRRPPDLSELISRLNERRHILGRKPSVLVVSFEPGSELEAAACTESLRQADLNARAAKDPGAAITSVVEDIPDTVIILAESLEEKGLQSFLLAMKSENDFARIPIVLATNAVNSDDILFHFGDVDPAQRTTSDYIAEQIASVLRTGSHEPRIAQNDDAGAESGILSDN